MKKAILFALVAFGLTTQNATAQSFSVAQDTVYSFTSGKVDVHNTINNLISSDLSLNWRLTNVVLPGGWSIDGVCDNNLCYTDVSNLQMSSKTTNPISGSGNMDFKVQYDGTAAPNNTAAIVTASFTDPSSFTTKSASFIATKVATGVISVTKTDDNVVIYPNPAKDDLNILFDGNSGVKNIAVYNLIGKVVNVYKVNGSSAKLNVSSIPSGIYFVRLLDTQGRIVATRKFTRQ